MNIDKMIEQWEEKHSSLLNDYSKGNANNEVMQMYRSQMKNVLDFIEQLKQVKNNFVLADVSGELPISCVNDFEKPEYCSQRSNHLCQKCKDW
jgi:hypothetical protein